METVIEEPVRLPTEAEREKEAVARNSVYIAFGITFTKAIVGVLTNSLGIISEAIHSGLDLLAAIVTYFAVRFSGKPADEDHQYGHSKIENFSALFEVLLLVLTSYWIFMEAIQKIKGHGEPPIVNFWSFAVMLLSIGLNLWRSRVLYQAAAKHGSQALEADALHFFADVISSSVVIVGLAFTTHFPAADPISAIFVALIILYACYDLGKEATNVLLDKAPKGLSGEIEKLCKSVPHVLEVKEVRVRGSAGEPFADICLVVASNSSTEEAHGIAHQVEKAIKGKLPKSEIIIHVEPAVSPSEDLYSRIRRAAFLHQGVLNLHNLEVMELNNETHITLHLEVNENLPIVQAHKIATELENEIKTMDGKISKVLLQIEPCFASHQEIREVTESRQDIVGKVKEFCGSIVDLKDCHNLRIYESGSRFFVDFHIRIANETPVSKVHQTMESLKERIFSKIPQVNRVTIHPEPLN